MSDPLSGTDDAPATDLFRAQTPPNNWVVYRVLRFAGHIPEPDRDGVCTRCPVAFIKHQPTGGPLRVLILLRGGPLRKLTMLTRDADELPSVVRGWVHTLHNIAEAAGVRIDGWIAYDGRG